MENSKVDREAKSQRDRSRHVGVGFPPPGTIDLNSDTEGPPLQTHLTRCYYENAHSILVFKNAVSSEEHSLIWAI